MMLIVIIIASCSKDSRVEAGIEKNKLAAELEIRYSNTVGCSLLKLTITLIDVVLTYYRRWWQHPRGALCSIMKNHASSSAIESLPVELIADILGELDLESLIKISYLSRRLHDIASDCSLNPWRRPILRNLRSQKYEDALKNLSVRLTVPRQNWIEVLSLASPKFILYDATLPNLKSAEWEECFNRRFLPGWRKWRKDGSWKEAYLKSVLHCTPLGCMDSDHIPSGCCIEFPIGATPPAPLMKHGPSQYMQCYTSVTETNIASYIVLNRNGTANEREITSRGMNPLVVFNEMKYVVHTIINFFFRTRA